MQQQTSLAKQPEVSFGIKLSMHEYSVKQIGKEYVVLSLGVPVLKFPSRAEAESAILEVSNLLLRPTLRRDDIPTPADRDTLLNLYCAD
jgi:hypothetical protein